MIINRIWTKNFRGIQNESFILNGKSMILFGINGSGKSTILHVVNLLFSRLINRIVQNRFIHNISVKSTDVRIGSTDLEVGIEFIFDNVFYQFGLSYDKKRNRTIIIGSSNLNAFVKAFMDKNESVYDDSIEQTPNLPIYVNYGAIRLVTDIPLKIRKTHVFDPLYAYENAVQTKVDFRTFFEWFRNREDYENEIRSREDINFSDNQLKAVRAAIEKMLVGFTDLSIKRNPLRMKINKEGTSFDVNQLSDGEKSLLAMIGDLARRTSMANPLFDNPLKCKGVVIIDEIEQHLHPSWQRKIVPTLTEIFPGIQFLISTHSPQILGELPDDMKVFKLSNTNSIFSKEEINTLRGWDTNSILENNMNTSSINMEFRNNIDRAYTHVEKGEYDVAEKIAEALEIRTNTKNSDAIRLKFLINRGRRKNDSNN